MGTLIEMERKPEEKPVIQLTGLAWALLIELVFAVAILITRWLWRIL